MDLKFSTLECNEIKKIIYDTPCVKCHFYAHLLKQACSKMSLNVRSVIK